LIIYFYIFLNIKKISQGNKAFIFDYTDPVDKSLSKNQGWIFRFENGSRIIFRTSGTSSSGATIRIYFEKYVSDINKLDGDVLENIKSEPNLVDFALDLSQINQVSNRDGPTVIT
jgi:phosphoglucomutase